MRRDLFLCVLFVVALLSAQRGPIAAAEPPAAKTADVVYVPTPHDVVLKMLELAGVKKGDVVYDLGCGDGRIVVLAAKKYGCQGSGFEIETQRVRESRANVKKNNVEKLVTIRQEDIFTVDLTPASVVTLYLLPTLNVKLIPQLEKLKPGSRIVSHDFDMQGIKEDDVEHTLYLWTVRNRPEAPLQRE